MIGRNMLNAMTALFLLSSGCSSIQHTAETNPNEDLQSTVKAISDAISTKQSNARYCPVCGKHYNSSVNTCAKDGTALREITP